MSRTDPEAALWAPVTSQDSQPGALAALSDVPLFKDCSTRELKKLLRIMHERTYHPNEVIFREGDPGAGVYIIKTGAVSIIARGRDGGERVLAELTDHHFFGEIALLEDIPRSATAMATAKTELLGFFEPDLEGLLDRDARLGSKVLFNLARLMATRLRMRNEAEHAAGTARR